MSAPPPPPSPHARGSAGSSQGQGPVPRLAGPIGPMGSASVARIARWAEVDELRRRIARFALIALAVFGTSELFAAGVWLAGGARQPDPGWVPLLALVGLVGVMRWGRPAARVVLVLDALTMIVLGLSWAADGLQVLNEPMEIPMSFVCTAALFVRSFVVPSWFTRSLWIGVATVAPTAAVVVWRGGASMATFGESAPRSMVAFTLMWLGVLVVLTAYASHTLFGLRRQVRAASSLGRYVLERKLGEGGMGAVFLGRHLLLRRPAAIKVLRPDRLSPQAVAAFEREVQITGALTHPNTVQVLDYGWTNDGVFYYVMEFLDGLDLEQLVRSEGAQPAWRVVHILRQASGALAEAHGHGLLHRDIKPANLMISERGGVPDVVHVLDFGLAAQLGATASGGLVGTPGYLAPEVIADPTQRDVRADLYALGAVAYWLLTGTPVFAAQSVADLCLRHVAAEPEPPSVRARSPIPEALERLVLQLLAKSPDERPASALEVQAGLDALAETSCRFDAAAARRAWQSRPRDVVSAPGPMSTFYVDVASRGHQAPLEPE